MANVGADSVDRGKKCPFQIRVFFSNSGHNNLSEYNRGNFTKLILKGTFN